MYSVASKQAYANVYNFLILWALGSARKFKGLRWQDDNKYNRCWHMC